MKVAILGGSFNPITRAHIEIAKYVFDRNVVDQIWLMPCYNHLQKTGLEAFIDRCKMCEIASKLYEDFIKVSNWEMIKGLDGSAYSLISRIKEDYDSGIVCGPSEKVDFSYIIGMDQANNFHTWKNWEKLKDMVRFIVIPRDGVKEDSKITWYLEKPHLYRPPLLGYPVRNVSSTRVREILKKYYTEPLQKYDPNHLSLSETKAKVTADIEERTEDSTYLIKAMDVDVLKYIWENRLYEKT